MTKYIDSLKAKIAELEETIRRSEETGNSKVWCMARVALDDVQYELNQAEWMEANK